MSYCPIDFGLHTTLEKNKQDHRFQKLYSAIALILLRNECFVTS